MDQQHLAATLTGWRRHLHAHPELSREEAATAAFVAARLDEIGVPYESGVGGHGVVATLRRGASNRSVGLRADMDALPIQEASGLAYASTRPGVMHACGHDGHTTALLGALLLLHADPDWAGTVQFVFQPAEEGAGGARAMLADGLLDRFPMERLFGFHNWPGMAAGVVMVHDGPVMAAASRVAITLRGVAGHAAMPHLTRDPMVAGAHLIVALQSVVSRTVDPLDSAVVSICTMETGRAVNQISDAVVMRGTVRALRPEVMDQVEAAIRRIADGTAATFDMQAETDIRRGIGVTRNSAAETKAAVAAVQDAGLTLRRDLPPTMGGEDFSWFLQERPGAFVWIGNGPGGDGRELHSPTYDFNDDILVPAARYLAGVAKRSLGTT